MKWEDVRENHKSISLNIYIYLFKPISLSNISLRITK